MDLDGSQFERFAQIILMWIGFGTIVGLAAKAIMPGRDPGGAVATLLMGIAGSVIGCAILKFFYPSLQITPISIAGFCMGTAGAFILLAFYKILGGYWFVEGEQMTHFHMRRRRRRSRRVSDAYLDD